MKVHKSRITFEKDLAVEENIELSEAQVATLYPIIEVRDCHLKGLIYRDDDDKLYADVDVWAKVTYKDGVSGEPFDYNFASMGLYEILEKEDGEGEGFIFPGGEFETEELTRSIIKFEMDPYLSKRG